MGSAEFDSENFKDDVLIPKEGADKMEKSPIEIMTVKQVRELCCNHPGCCAGKDQMGYEVASEERRTISVFCPSGHKRSVQVKLDGIMKRRDSVKVGICETQRCNRHWISTAGNRRFCECCQNTRDRKSREAWSKRYSVQRRKAKQVGVEA